jgi:RNA polymerase sigma factor for flagellar operon FliA
VSAKDSPEVLERFHAELPLVEIIAAQISRSVGSSIEYDDLVGAGREGLLDAARRFEPARGVPFRAYANIRVRGTMLDGVRHLSLLPRRAYERISALKAAASVSEGEAEGTFGVAPAATPSAADEALAEHLSAIALAAAVGIAAETEGEASDSEHSPEEALGRAELIHAVRSAIAELSSDEGEIVRRHYLEGERLEGIGSDLGMSRSWASRLHTRAVARLAKRLRHVA